MISFMTWPAACKRAAVSCCPGPANAKVTKDKVNKAIAYFFINIEKIWPSRSLIFGGSCPHKFDHKIAWEEKEKGVSYDRTARCKSNRPRAPHVIGRNPLQPSRTQPAPGQSPPNLVLEHFFDLPDLLFNFAGGVFGFAFSL